MLEDVVRFGYDSVKSGSDSAVAVEETQTFESMGTAVAKVFR